MFILCRFNLAYTVYVFNLYIKQGEKSKQYSTFNQSSVNINLKFVKALVGLSFTSLKNTSGKFRFKLGRIKPWNYLVFFRLAGNYRTDLYYRLPLPWPNPTIFECFDTVIRDHLLLKCKEFSFTT